jgi:chromosomal replication initiation ATPase DnaA
VAAPDSRTRQLALELGHTPSLIEADFMVGDSNRLAVRHVAAWPDWAGPFTLVTGPAKSGKSHLAGIWLERAGAKLADPADMSMGSHDGPVLIEDADRAGYDEADLFGILNQCLQRGRSVLMTARAEPGNWPYATDDVNSRVRLAAHFRLNPPTDIELSQMFVKLFADRQVSVDPKVIAYLVKRMERAHETAVALVERMDDLALSRGSAITRGVAAEALEQLESHAGLSDEE